MLHSVTTFTDFILEDEEKHPQPNGNLPLLLVQLENAVKIIASHVREAGLSDILGQTGKLNAFSEEVQKLDEFSNALLIKTLTSSGQVHTIVSEELSEAHVASPNGSYDIFFDPLDGSSNIDNNNPIGTIFSLYHHTDDLLKKGSEQLAAGYVMYGASTMLVYTSGHGVNGFTLDPAVGSFLLSHPDIKIPDEGNTYSINEAYFPKYNDSVKQFISQWKEKPKASARYVGALIADIHRTLLKGGIFLYPTDSSHLEGKLRLMLEVNPIAFLVEQAGGETFAVSSSPLDTKPLHIHERSPFVAGSPTNVKEYKKYV